MAFLTNPVQLSNIFLSVLPVKYEFDVEGCPPRICLVDGRTAGQGPSKWTCVTLIARHEQSAWRCTPACRTCPTL